MGLKPGKLNGSLIIGYDFSKEDSPLLVVGLQKDGKMDILNAIVGPDAKRLFNELITRKGDNHAQN